MTRRTWVATLASLKSGAVAPVVLAVESAHPIHVPVDMSVDPAKEREMLRHFEQDFKLVPRSSPATLTSKS